MVSSIGGEDLSAKRKNVVAQLVKGKGIAIQLKTLFQSRDWQLGLRDDVVLAKDLSIQMMRSFSQILSIVNSCGSLPAVDGGDRGKKKPAVVKQGRGCYKRRKKLESRVIESPTTQDGHAWRKYGQKAILNSQHPRCYYRCTHKPEGCKAKKQVQIIKDNPTITYLVTYLNHHTCSTDKAVIASYGDHLIAADTSTIINFQHNETSSSNNNKKDNHNSRNTEIKTSSVVKVEGVADDQSNEGANFSDDTKSTALTDAWPGLGLDHKPAEWSHDPMVMFESGFGHQSCESTNLLQYGYGEADEVNQIGEFDTIYFDQELIF